MFTNSFKNIQNIRTYKNLKKNIYLGLLDVVVYYLCETYLFAIYRQNVP